MTTPANQAISNPSDGGKSARAPGVIFGELGNFSPNAQDRMQVALQHRLACANRVIHGPCTLAGTDVARSPTWIIAVEGQLVRGSNTPAPTPAQLLAAIESVGVIAAVKPLEGAFVIAAYHVATRQLWLARDPTGQRALCYAQSPAGICFSSEIKALVARKDLPLQIDHLALLRYLSCAYLPAEATLFQNIRTLPPGSVFCFDSSGTLVSRTTYWRATEPTDVEERDRRVKSSEQESDSYSRALRSSLEDVVGGYLEQSDSLGPAAAFLSGGVDSSLVVALAAKLGRKPHCFSISFGPHLPNELEFSSMVAKAVGTEHQVVEVSGSAMAELLEDTVYYLDDPIGDPLTVPNVMLSKTAQKQGFQRVLNGEGGDPCFGGPKNIPMVLSQWYGEPAPLDREKAYMRSYQKLYEDLTKLVQTDVLTAAQNIEPIESFLTAYFEDPETRSFLNKLQLMNLVLKGGYNILCKVERIYGTHNLLPISPLFDRRIAEQAWLAPPSLKLKGNVEKYVLKQAVKDILPEPIIERKKSGMLVPVHPWFQTVLEPFAADTLSEKSIKKRGLFNYEAIKDIRNYRGAMGVRGFYGAKLWLLVTLEVWMRLFVDGGYSRYQSGAAKWQGE